MGILEILGRGHGQVLIARRMVGLARGPMGPNRSRSRVSFWHPFACRRNASSARNCALGVPKRTMHRAFPLVIKDIDDAVDLTAGRESACVRRKDGSVWCWEAIDDDLFWNGTRWRSWSVPIENKFFHGTIAQIHAGYFDTCARSTGGRI